MVLINKAINEVTVKLVYYGPGLCGKTTNLEKIYGNPKLENKGKMISMSTETDRTLFFDFMPMELGTIAGQKVRVQLYTVPGQVFYDATRKLVLRGADGVVFVADSQASMRESNIDSLENLKTNLRINRLDPDKVALVLQYNKRDLPAVSTVEEMNEYLNPGNLPTVEASAITGTGVTATLRAAVARILDNLKNNVDTTLYDQPELTAPDMSARSGVTASSAGIPKLSMRSVAEQARATAPPKPAAPAPMAASPFENAFSKQEDVEDDPFGSVAVEHSAVEADLDDPFAAVDAAVEAVIPTPAPADNPFGAHETAVQHGGASEEQLLVMLASARDVVQALESALERARDHERLLLERLS
jgi:signal recognition particle receptor subunit beta